MSRLHVILLAVVIAGVVGQHGHDTDQPATFDCHKNGLFPDYQRHCQAYYRCENGEQTTYGCPDGQIFTTKFNKCMSTSVATCD
ncbi:chitinase-like mite allergen Der p 18.0101 [Penaeus indicus]|uniref:chitinase-like mite allergen Der p 18.0101 n=1 Tax=Penaeus indicus TaxID=29960 RepID=UPI00300D6848